jgi:hypothetical protein
MGIFVLGLVVGLALGLVIIGFLAIGSFDRGRDSEAIHRRRITQAT